MKRNRFYTVLIGVAILLTSCDCVQIARAKVLDATNKRPIGDVKVYKESNKAQNTLTDENGLFELRSISGGYGGCPVMTVVFTKAGYRTKTVEADANSATIIYLDRE